MRKIAFLCALALGALLLWPRAAWANMAAPAEPDVGTAITFEQSDAIAVSSEVLDIVVHGATADITAAYQMKNTTDTAVSTPAMFLSPNIEDGGVTVTAGGQDVPFTAETYLLNYDTQVKTEDWRFAVLTGEAAEGEEEWGEKLDAVSFTLTFAPQEETEVVVSYVYALGGYPDYDFNAKRGEIEYYLTPAALWKDFSDLTIHLTLDKDMPVIKSSSVEFEKTGARTYQYHSDTLPEENLSITIDENWFQNIFSTLRSPYFAMNLWFVIPILLVGAAVIAVVAWCLARAIRKRRRSL